MRKEYDFSKGQRAKHAGKRISIIGDSVLGIIPTPESRGETESRVPQLDVLAFEFFREFARCEYCLKAIGFRKKGRDARADWTGRFAEEVQSVIEGSTSPAVQAAVAYFLKNPPKKQVIKKENLDWSNTLPTHKNKTELILLLVCRVRNNLFHGGKFNARWFAPQQSEELISHGLVVLKACIAGHPQMNEAYIDRAE
jgi:hypothetical protein